MSLTQRGLLWSGLYLAAVLAPLGVALACGPAAAPRPFGEAFGLACGFVAFAVVAFEFALVGRLRRASEPFGTDALMLFHRGMGQVALAFVAAHALLEGGPAAAPSSGRAGWIAALATGLLVAIALLRRRLPLAYERWRTAHGALALLAVGAMLAHVTAARGPARVAPVTVVLWAYALAVVALMLRYRLLRPLRLWRRPWEVVAVRDEGGDTRTLVVQPVGHAGFGFSPGQFAWLNTGRTPLHAEQHPLSISSSAAPVAGRRLEFSIKALGDWSGTTVPALAPGARVWVDGPFGAFTPDRVPFEGLALIAGGIGVAPLRSMLLTLADRGDRRPVVLFFATRDRSRAMFADELEALPARLNLTLVPVHEQPEPGWQGERGFVTGEMLARHLPPGSERWHHFVCGPGPMMDALERALARRGVPAGQIHTERFDMV